MSLSKFTGEVAGNQKLLTRQFIQLHCAFPSTNDLFFDSNENGSFIFDGTHWREFDLDNILRAVQEK